MPNKVNDNDEIEIDLFRLLSALWRHAAVILIVGIIFSAGSVFYARRFVTPMYEADALFYVNNSTLNIGSSAIAISTGELSAANDLVDTYVAIMESRANMELVARESGLPYPYEELRTMVSAKAVNSTGLFRVVVRCSDPEEARTLANTIADILPDKIAEIVFNSSVEVVDYAVTPHSRVSPSYLRYAAIGLLLGMVLVSAIVVINELRDDVIHDEDFLLQNYDAPLLATIPDLNARGSKRYGYSKYGKYGKYGKSYEYGYGSYEASAKKSSADASAKKGSGTDGK